MKMIEVVRERERESSNLENTKGVTLIALVITIIVLLILVGVVLNTVLGNDGIIAKAELAREKTNNAQREEQEKLNNLENEIGKVGSARAGSFEYDILWDWETTDEEGNVTQTVANTGSITLNKSIENYKFLVVFAKGNKSGIWCRQVSTVVPPVVTKSNGEYANTYYQYTDSGYTIVYGFLTPTTLDIQFYNGTYSNCTISQVWGVK